MRIAELSRYTGMPVPTIKYYLREGLVPPGERTSPNQAQYSEEHVRRLKLVRALIDVGGLSVAAAKTVLANVDTPDRGILHSLGKAQYSITVPREHVEDEAWAASRRDVDELIGRHGWQVRPRNPARGTLAEVIATLRRLGQEDYVAAVLDDYAATAERLAETEVREILRRPDVDSMAEAVVIWTLLGDALLAALRRLAQEAAAERLTSTDQADGHVTGAAATASSGPAPASRRRRRSG
ncbi:MerR family transcriptional regulator [Kutzneria buriramensis]|uniref:MerR-like DNA binding protein n=1 Tax=Kutzneria buriramensis TaxID=1045776 RepID=A0A3E0HKM3_9PSEU|nr:MerR family transcriptional regulator [Kutzneria buriramensis]REH47042.1 MerR-like DNA binding protein [Kutzneria buriramensis]